MLERPSAHASTMRARSARRCAEVGLLDQLSKVCRSSSFRTNGVLGRPIAMCVLLFEDSTKAGPMAQDFLSEFLIQDTRSKGSDARRQRCTLLHLKRIR